MFNRALKYCGYLPKMPRLSALPRLARTSVVSLWDHHACYCQVVQKIDVGNALVTAKIEWRRRNVLVSVNGRDATVSLAFKDRAAVTLGGEKFNVTLARPDRHSDLSLKIVSGLASDNYHFTAPTRWQSLLAIATTAPKIAGVILRDSNDIVAFLRTEDPAISSRLRKSFGLTPQSDRACVIEANLLGRPQDPIIIPPATILVPVFNAADDLARLLPRLEHAPCPIIFVDDASNDPRIALLLDSFSLLHPQTTILSQSKNMGFVAAVNRGLEHTNGHVILLNTDTLPPTDWVGKLLAPIIQDDCVASVTPFSNNAEILSIPAPGIQGDISEALVDAINQVACCISASHQTVALPTGIGFCMALNRRFVDLIGGFDPVFGRGYGEEVDWCRKATQAGGHHVALASLFVGHKGGASFGADKGARVEKAGKIIRKRYPTYDQEVQSWIENAPLQSQSLALSLAWLAEVSDCPVPIFLGHSLGGGAETALQAELDSCLNSACPRYVLLRVGGPSRWRIELRAKGVSLIGDAMDEATIVALLNPIQRRRLVYSCGVGARHPTDAANLLQALMTANASLEAHIHDFFPISPSWNLLDQSGRFHGVPDIRSTDTAHKVPVLDGQCAVPHMKWREQWTKVFSDATRIVVFSNSSRALIAEAFPKSATRIVVRPHNAPSLPARLIKGGHAIGVLGSINRAKGGEVLLRLAKSKINQRRIVVIGEMDGSFSLPKPHLVHGRFAHDQIGALAKAYDIGGWLIPSICPETFSFATHEALATGLPVLAFMRGAQGETVDVAPNGFVIRAEPEDTIDIVRQIELAFSR